ncbi:MAG: nucleotide exchange factor GrpE [Rhizobiaceae bacterium]
MPGNPDDALFDDLAAEEERMAAEEQAEMDAAEAEEAASPEPEADPNDPATVLAVLDKLKAENEELKDKTLRTVAEMENLRRRTAREIADTRSYAVANFARDLLGVGDNLQRAIQAVSEEKRECGSEEFKNLLEGVELTERELLKALDKAGVTKFNPEGEKFDPNLHQAMFEMPDENKPNNSVAQVVQEGYKIGERVLRPAMVGVAKGGPKFEAAVAEEATAEEAASEDEVTSQED